MRIAEFSRETGISTRMLRHHHRRGHLVPAEIDDATGYRTYDPRQVEVARRLAALVRTGMDPVVAAEVARGGRPNALLSHLRRVEQDLDTLRRPELRPRGTTVAWDIGAAHVLVREGTVDVHGVADEVRRAKADLRSATRREPATFPPAHRGGPTIPRTSLHLELVDARWGSTRVRTRLLVPWAAGRPAPDGWRVSRVGRRSLVVVEVGALASASLTDVMEAHRVLATIVGRDQGRERLWQLYDPAVSRLWVAREVAASRPVRQRQNVEGPGPGGPGPSSCVGTPDRI